MHVAKNIQNVSKQHAKINFFWTCSCPSNGHFGSGGDSFGDNFLGPSKSERPRYFFGSFYRHLVEFGRDFETSWGARGSPNRVFGHLVVPKSIETTTQGRLSEKAWNSDQQIFGKCKVLNVLNPPKCFIYKHLGGFRWFRKTGEIHEKYIPK